MENSLRYDGDSKSLRIHAKEKIPLASKTLLQVHGELDTGTGTPSYLALIVRHFYPELSASMGFGIQLNKDEKPCYSLRGKKAFPVTASGLVGINLKGRFHFDKEYKEARGAVELAWSVLNFQKDQDVRFKIGFDICDQVPYFQIRENNWTLNADINDIKCNTGDNLDSNVPYSLLEMLQRYYNLIHESLQLDIKCLGNQYLFLV
nr:PREDICTED: outer envelope pore protein 21B, chloroplastic isoform X1 [Musa acuminata subsp. malaccensis]